MAVFNFDQVDNYVQSTGSGISFLKLEDNGWQAKVRFMYGPGETFQGYTTHNVSQEPGKNKYVQCIRELGQPLDSCPLCKAGIATQIHFFIPVFVISITKAVNGVAQAEEKIEQVMLFQRGKTFTEPLSSVVRQSAGTPLISNVFNLVRVGKKGDTNTQYMVEFIGRDDKTLDMFPERPQVLGSYVLGDMKFDEMAQLVASRTGMPQGVVPRQVTNNYEAPKPPSIF